MEGFPTVAIFDTTSECEECGHTALVHQIEYHVTVNHDNRPNDKKTVLVFKCGCGHMTDKAIEGVAK